MRDGTGRQEGLFWFWLSVLSAAQALSGKEVSVAQKKSRKTFDSRPRVMQLLEKYLLLVVLQLFLPLCWSCSPVDVCAETEAEGEQAQKAEEDWQPKAELEALAFLNKVSSLFFILIFRVYFF